jgi:YkoY family integral membrane protein
MDIQYFLKDITDHPLHALTVILNLVLIESLLSVDNAAVIATMVLGLSKKERGKALSYGIIGAYIFRGLCLFFATFLIQIWWLKALAGLYLIYLFMKYFIKTTSHEEEKPAKQNLIYKNIVKLIGPFWATVLSVELMDLTFSIDNVFAAVAFTRNIILVWIGVFIGILAMRIVARFFVLLMEKFPFLETSAFIVLGILGIKLALSLYEHFYPSPDNPVTAFLNSEEADWLTSAVTVGIFILPILTSVWFNIPKRHGAQKQ